MDGVMRKDQALKNLIGTAQAALLAAKVGVVLGDEYADQLKKDIDIAKKALAS